RRRIGRDCWLRIRAWAVCAGCVVVLRDCRDDRMGGAGMSMENKAAQTVASLAGLYQREVEPDAKQRTAGYWWGAQDEDVGWWLSLCRMVKPDPAQAHYIAHVGEDWRVAHKLKAWAYRVAVEYAGSRGSGQRK